MSRRSKITTEEKIKVAQDCTEGRISRTEAARQLGVGMTSIRGWIARYEAEGSLGLAETEKNRVYSEEIKRQAVKDYLGGVGSQTEICKKYKIRERR